MLDYHSRSCHENLKHVAASKIDVVSSVVSLHYIQGAYITVISFERVVGFAYKAWDGTDLGEHSGLINICDVDWVCEEKVV